MHIEQPTPEQAKDIAAEDAHMALRSALLPHILRRPDAGVIVRRIAAGTELCLDYLPDSRLFEAAVIYSTRTSIMVASLADDPAANDLYNVLGLALTTAVNAEAEERQRAVAAAVAEGAIFACRLRVNAATEVLGLLLMLNGVVIWQAHRAVPFDGVDRLRPEVTVH